MLTVEEKARRWKIVRERESSYYSEMIGDRRRNASWGVGNYGVGNSNTEPNWLDARRGILYFSLLL